MATARYKKSGDVVGVPPDARSASFTESRAFGHAAAAAAATP
ncbi:hypothetical protein ACFXPS_03460 [Nocardia sp. NPDC059091]